MSKFDQFLEIAGYLNETLDVVPLLFGSLGLQQRLGMDMRAEDIDILVPESWLNDGWDPLKGRMEELGYSLYDLHEHAFLRDGVSAAFAALESLEPFAGVECHKIPLFTEGKVRYLLLELTDYRKVYAQSALDGYRADKKNKRDNEKLALIDRTLRRRGAGET